MSTENHFVLTKLFKELQVLKTDLTSDLSLYTDQFKSLSWWKEKRRDLLYFNREESTNENPFALEILQNTLPGENYQLSYRGQLNHLLTDFVHPLQTIVVEKDKELTDEGQLPRNIPVEPQLFEPSTDDDNLRRMQMIVHRRQQVLYQKARENQKFLGEYRELLAGLSHDLSKIAETVKNALGESGTTSTVPIFNTKQKPMHKKGITQAQLALFYYYCHAKKCLPDFQAGRMEQSYKEVTQPYELAWKPFQQAYNRFKNRADRLNISNRQSLKAAIQMLNEYPKALELAQDELNTAETRNLIT